MENLSKVEEKVVRLLDKQLMSISELSKKLNLNRQYLKGILESLEDRDYVKHNMIGRSIVYTPTKKIQIEDSNGKTSMEA